MKAMALSIYLCWCMSPWRRVAPSCALFEEHAVDKEPYRTLIVDHQSDSGDVLAALQFLVVLFKVVARGFEDLAFNFEVELHPLLGHDSLPVAFVKIAFRIDEGAGDSNRFFTIVEGFENHVGAVG